MTDLADDLARITRKAFLPHVHAQISADSPLIAHILRNEGAILDATPLGRVIASLDKRVLFFDPALGRLDAAYHINLVNRVRSMLVAGKPVSEKDRRKIMRLAWKIREIFPPRSPSSPLSERKPSAILRKCSDAGPDLLSRTLWGSHDAECFGIPIH